MDRTEPKASNLRFSSRYNNRERNCVEFVPNHPSPEAQICLGCNIPVKKCKGACDRYKTEYRKLRGQGDGK